MPSTQPYAPIYDFATDPDPQNKVNATALQVELQDISAQFSDLLTAISTTIRDDDQLADGVVSLRTLATETSTYIQSAIDGSVATNALVFKLPVRVASTADLGDPSALIGFGQTIDGVIVAAGDRVLLKDQTAPDQNGLWVVGAALTPWVRASDLDTGDNADAGWAVCVREGTLNGSLAWAILAGSTELIVVGTDDITFFPVFGVYPVPLSKGGTGATTAAGARAALAAPGVYRGSIAGNDATTVFTITHNLGQKAVTASFYDDSTGEEILPLKTVLSTTQIQAEFVTAPSTGQTIIYTVIG